MSEFRKIICEKWRDIPGWPYKASNVGRIMRSKGGGNNAKIGRILRPNIDKDGYLYVRLCKNGKIKDFKVHQIICLVFHGASSLPFPQCRHLDGNRQNNHESNLTWGTAKENAEDRDKHGNVLKGERSPFAKLTQYAVDEIRMRYYKARQGRQRVPRGFILQLAQEYGLTRHGIATIVSGRGYNK